MEDVLETGVPSRVPLAGYWRRIGAFAIDWLILAVGGFALGQLLFDPLAWLGGWDRLVGFVLALVFFGLLDSGPFGAATPGKRALGLRVVDRAGRVLPLSRSLVRSALFLAPIMFSGTILFIDNAGYGELAWSGLMGSLLAASFYVLLFNRATRQGLHDLVAGSYVIHGRASRKTMETLTASWRKHLVVALIFVVLGVPLGIAGYPFYFHMTPTTRAPVSLAPTLGAPYVRGAWMRFSPVAGSPRTCEQLTVMLRGKGVDDESIARQAAARIVSHMRCHIDTNLAVRMMYGFDLGFYGGLKYRDFTIDEAAVASQP